MTMLTDRLIYIAVPLKLQNALMASFLELETGAKCLAVEKFHIIQEIDDENTSRPKLSLGLDLSFFPNTKVLGIII